MPDGDGQGLIGAEDSSAAVVLLLTDDAGCTAGLVTAPAADGPTRIWKTSFNFVLGNRIVHL